MKTIKQIVLDSFDAGRSPREFNKKELLDALEAIAQNIKEGKATALDANVLLSVRESFMSETERLIDAARVDAELSMMAASLGKKGGEIRSEAKAKASRENGKKGGRPRKKKD